MPESGLEVDVQVIDDDRAGFGCLKASLWFRQIDEGGSRWPLAICSNWH